jgi:hypothetical protein
LKGSLASPDSHDADCTGAADADRCPGCASGGPGDLDYDAADRPDERFDGINLDIEPHVLDQWAVRPDQLAR